MAQANLGNTKHQSGTHKVQEVRERFDSLHLPLVILVVGQAR